MPDLRLNVESAEVVQYAAIPSLAFKVQVVNLPSEEIIHTIALRAQIQIEVTRRKYDASEQAKLRDLFGEPDRWGQTLRNMLWTHASVMVPRFSGSTLTEIPVPCTFDFNVAATKYFHGLTSGDLPLCFQFSGTIFYQREDGTLQVSPISWEQRSEVPVAGQGMERPDGLVLPEFRLVGIATRHIRKALSVQSERRNPHLGRSAGEGARRSPGNGALMNAAMVDGIVKAVLYEGYMLYPYRPSAVKNRQRFNFGVVYPRAYSHAQGGTDAWSMQTECLVQGNGLTHCTVRVRFLRMVERSVGKPAAPTSELSALAREAHRKGRKVGSQRHDLPGMARGRGGSD